EVVAGSALPSISWDGRLVCFFSDAIDLVPYDTNGQADLFVHDRLTGSTIRASVGAPGYSGSGRLHPTAVHCISGDGRSVLFSSASNSLVEGDTNAVSDVFVRTVPRPTLSRIEPASGSEAGGDRVHLVGSDLAGGPGTSIAFGDRPASIVSA